MQKQSKVLLWIAACAWAPIWRAPAPFDSCFVGSVRWQERGQTARPNGVLPEALRSQLRTRGRAT